MSTLKRAGNALTSQDQIDIRRDIGLGTAATVDVPASGDASSTQVVKGNDTRLTNSREWTAATVSQAEAEAGTDTARKAWTVQRVWQAITKALGGVTVANTPTTGQVLTATGATAATWQTPSGGAGATNLSYTASPTNGVVASDTGTDATLPLSDGTNAGLMAPAQHTKLAGLNAADYATAAQGTKADSAMQASDVGTVATQVEVEAGTGTSVQRFSVLRLWQAMAAWLLTVSTSAGRALMTAADAAAQRTAMEAARSGAVTGSGLTMATARLLGRSTGSTGAVEEITVGSGLTLSAGTLTASGGGGGGTKSIAVFTPMDSQPPASNFATLDTRNSIAVLDFDAAADESATWVSVIPEAANLASGLTIRIVWAATSATSGNCRWRVAFEDMIGSDIDSDSFDAAAEATGAANGTSGTPTVTSITITTIDSLAAGDAYRLRVTRVGTDATNDTMTGDAEIIAVEVRGVA